MLLLGIWGGYLVQWPEPLEPDVLDVCSALILRQGFWLDVLTDIPSRSLPPPPRLGKNLFSPKRFTKRMYILYDHERSTRKSTRASVYKKCSKHLRSDRSIVRFHSLHIIALLFIAFP
jgi:hypothetical protein